MTRTILLADDSVTIQKVIELTFMDEDYEVVAVGNGDEALEKLDEMTPDFVIADVHMPGADGYDVAKHSKSLRPEVPVLLLVSTFEPFDEEAAERCGCDAYLKKPFDSQELQRLVEELSAEASGEAGGATARASEPEPVQDWGGPVPEELPEVPEMSAEPFAIGLDDLETEEEPPTRVPPPASVGSTAGEPSAWGAGGGRDDGTEAADGATQAEPEVFEMEPDDFERAAEHAGPTGEPPVPDRAPADASDEAGGAEAPVSGPLSDEDVERVARRVVELLGDRPVREVAWEVVPDLAEVVIRDRLRELETQVESAE
jgi:CheY-like chemotaxis protein